MNGLVVVVYVITTNHTTKLLEDKSNVSIKLIDHWMRSLTDLEYTPNLYSNHLVYLFVSSDSWEINSKKLSWIIKEDAGQKVGLLLEVSTLTNLDYFKPVLLPSMVIHLPHMNVAQMGLLWPSLRLQFDVKLQIPTIVSFEGANDIRKGCGLLWWSYHNSMLYIIIYLYCRSYDLVIPFESRNS